MGPLISIVVPLYNEGNNVVGLVKHIAELAGIHETILVDASNQEDSRAVLVKLSQKLLDAEFVEKKFVLVGSESAGRGIQMNLGASHATGDILVFLHCDTRLPPDAGSKILEVVSSGFSWGRFDVSLESNGLIYRIIEFMINLRSRLRRIATGDQAMFVESSLFDRMDGFPEIALMEDIAICKKLNALTRPGLVKSPVITSARRWRNRGPITTVLLMWKLRFLFWLGKDPRNLAKMYNHER